MPTLTLVNTLFWLTEGLPDRVRPRLVQLSKSNLHSVNLLRFSQVHAFAWLRRTDELSNHNYPWFERDKNWSKLRSDPEYQRILAGIKRHWERYREEFGGG